MGVAQSLNGFPFGEVAPRSVRGEVSPFGTAPCAQFCAYDSLGAVGKARKWLDLVEPPWHKNEWLEGRFVRVSH